MPKITECARCIHSHTSICFCTHSHTQRRVWICADVCIQGVCASKTSSSSPKTPSQRSRSCTLPSKPNEIDPGTVQNTQIHHRGPIGELISPPKDASEGVMGTLRRCTMPRTRPGGASTDRMDPTRSWKGIIAPPKLPTHPARTTTPPHARRHSGRSSEAHRSTSPATGSHR